MGFWRNLTIGEQVGHIFPFIPLILIFIGFILILTASKIVLTLQADYRQRFVNDLKVIFDAYHLQSETASSMLYQYIRTNKADTVQSKPIYSKVSEATWSCYWTFSSREDLCQTIFASHNSTLCYGIANGANSKWLAGIVSYIAQSIAFFVKEFFDTNINSPTVVEDTLDLKELKEIEIEFTFLHDVFEQVEINFHESDNKEQNQFITMFFVVIILLVVIEVMIWILLFKRVYKKAKNS